MNQSESIAKLAEALSKAQGEMSHAHKGSDNPFFKSKYADLPSVIDAARPHLSSNGISVVQVTDFDENVMWVVTQLNHNSGEWIRGRYKIKPVKDDPQGIGSAITYARRYAYQAMVGIATSLDDDDGNAASGRTSQDTIAKAVFANAKLRNDFTKNVISSFAEIDDASEDALDSLKTLQELNSEKLSAMKTSGNEHDEMALDEIRKQYSMKKRTIEIYQQTAEQLRVK